jgi:hypothetical protein
MTQQTRRYSIKITDLDAGEDVIFAAADWTVEEKRPAVAQVLRLAGVPEDAGDCFIGEIAPSVPRRKG